jgi:rhodanese-related sulfurtransferase
LSQLLDCLVNYFSYAEDGEGMPSRYFVYHVVGGPGATAGAGVAVVHTLAVYAGGERCESCQDFHVVREGGPAAAIDKALRYLDAFHGGDRLRKVRTAIRGDGPVGGGRVLRPDPDAELPLRMSVEELLARLEAGQPVSILDARNDEDWGGSGVKVRGALRVPHGQVPAGSLPKDRLTVAYCTCPNDAGAVLVAQELQGHGFRQAYALRGGFDAWRAAGGPVEPR